MMTQGKVELMNSLRRKRNVSRRIKRKSLSADKTPAGSGKAETDPPRLNGGNKSGTDPAENRLPTLREVECNHILHVLRHVNHNRTRAAEILGIDRVSLWRKIKKMGLSP
ncbi:MAG: hypothetical protein M8357_05470 [Desulfobulbaceae bacterium]|nr:hypothetical protein [Desulfobulbaceae bacterium]